MGFKKFFLFCIGIWISCFGEQELALKKCDYTVDDCSCILYGDEYLSCPKQTTCCYKVFGDLLAYQLVEGIPYIIDLDLRTIGPSEYLFKTRFVENRFKPRLGFEAGVSFCEPFSCIQLTIGYKFFHPSYRVSKIFDSPTTLIVPVGVFFFPKSSDSSGLYIVAKEAIFNWNLDYDTFDAVVETKFLRAKYIGLTALGGFKGAFIYQKGLFNYIGDTVGLKTEGVYKLNYHGGGAVVGIHANSQLCQGFSFSTKYQGGLMYGFFQIDAKEDLFVDEAVIRSGSQIKDQFFRLNYYSNIRMSLDYHCGRLSSSVGVEGELWHNFYQNSVPANTTQGLGLVGLRGSISYLF